MRRRVCSHGVLIVRGSKAPHWNHGPRGYVIAGFAQEGDLLSVFKRPTYSPPDYLPAFFETRGA